MEYCRHYGNLEAMSTAKSNIEKYYPVVAVLEHMNMSLVVMENKLPQFFKGALHEFYTASNAVDGAGNDCNCWVLPKVLLYMSTYNT